MLTHQNTYAHSPLVDTPAWHSESHGFNFPAEGENSEFHSDMFWYRLLLLQYHFLPDTSDSLQATEHTVI